MPTFGKPTTGASNEALGAGVKWFCMFTTPGNVAEIDSISAYVNRSGTGSGYAVRAGIYTNLNASPSALVSNSAIEISTNIARNAPAWYTGTYVTKPVLNPSTVYWLGVQAVKASLVYFDAGATGQQVQASDAYADGLAATFGTITATHAHEQSVYASYSVDFTEAWARFMSLVGNIAPDYPNDVFTIDKYTLQTHINSDVGPLADNETNCKAAMTMVPTNFRNLLYDVLTGAA